MAKHKDVDLRIIGSGAARKAGEAVKSNRDKKKSLLDQIMQAQRTSLNIKGK